MNRFSLSKGQKDPLHILSTTLYQKNAEIFDIRLTLSDCHIHVL